MTSAMKGAIETWRKLYGHYLSMQRTALELFAHPDATDEQILCAARALGRTRATLSDSRHKLVTHKDYPRVWLRRPTIEEMKL